MSKRYVVVALVKADEERVSTFLGAQSGRGLRVLYDGYAPRAWIVSYNGSAKQLADVLWPDEFDEDEFALKSGLVIQASDATINGWAVQELWELFSDGSD